MPNPDAPLRAPRAHKIPIRPEDIPRPGATKLIRSGVVKEPSFEPTPTVEEYEEFEEFLGNLTVEVEEEERQAALRPPSCTTCSEELMFDDSYDAYWCSTCKDFRAI